MRELQKRLAQASGPGRRTLLATVVLGALTAIVIVAQATLLAHAITSGFEGTGLSALAGTLVLLALLSVVRGFLSFGFEASGRLGASRVMAWLRRSLVDRLLERPGELNGESSAGLATAAVQGVDALEAFFAKYLPQLVLAALVPPAVLIWTFPRDWEAAVILAVTVPLIPVFMILIGKATEQSVKRRWHRLSVLSETFSDVVGGLETLKALNAAEAQGELIEEASDGYRRETMATLRIGFLSALVLELFAMLGTAVVAATVGIQLANSSLAFEPALTVLILAPEVYMPLRQLGAQFHASADGVAAAERIFEILDREPSVTLPETALPCPDPRLAPLSMTSIAFSHPGRDEFVLRGVDLAIRPGETVALVGASGSGKTTLASLILRFADPDEGVIRCGDTDLRDVDPVSWRRRLAWVPQRPTVFAGSIRDNVRLALPDAGDDEVLNALAAVHADRFVSELPEGLDTIVGEGGRPLSAGETHRMALARAFIGDPSLVVLDEPTAHLDHETAADVWRGIEALTESRSALLIAHRASLAASADRIVELRGGSLSAPIEAVAA